MPETPDFNQIAQSRVDQFLPASESDLRHALTTVIAEQLRLVWNARGAADLEAVNDVAHTNERPIERAIRSLDREPEVERILIDDLDGPDGNVH